MPAERLRRLARFFHHRPVVPFRRPVKAFALAAALLAAFSPWRVPAGPALPAEAECGGGAGSGGSGGSGECERCPARRVPPACSTCQRSVEGVAARRVRLVAPAPRRVERPPLTVESPEAPRRRATALRHEVRGASPPTHLLLATLRN